MISEINQAIVTTINTDLNNRGILLGDCRLSGGRITLDELGEIGALSPAVLVSVQRIRDIELYSRDKRRFVMDYSAFVVCTGNAELNRDEQAYEIVDHLIGENRGVLPGNRWGLSYCRSIETPTIEATNLYSGNANELGVAIWGLTWEQIVDTGITT